MSLVEKDITSLNIERAQNHSEFEKRREREQKLVATSPEAFEEFKSEALPLEQIYLSSPHDEFSLRVRSVTNPEGTSYTATLKDRGEVKDGVRDRLEVTTEISAEAYKHYAANATYPRIRKLRAEPLEGLTIDFLPLDTGISAIVEIEHPEAEQRAQLSAQLEQLTDETLQDVTDSTVADNERIAYQYSNVETLASPETLDAFADRVVREMVAHHVTGKAHVITGLTGMSGSGKTTVTRLIHDRLVEAFGQEYAPLVISTDDYHFGKKYLDETYGFPWTEWDDPRTYNTVELARDLQLMKEGNPLLRRHFDFATEEPVLDDFVAASPFIVIEGLYAGSTDLQEVRDTHFRLPTGIATSVGRDVRRLVIDNRANRVFPTPESRLRYQIETALPLYLEQEQPVSNGYSGCVRPLAERAFMLQKLG